MGLPSGVSTATVTFGTDADVLGVGATTTLTITPSHTLIWAATGEIIRAFSVSVDAAANVVGSFEIPHTDQVGFTDELGRAITNWYYTVAGLVTRGGEVQPYRKVFQVTSDVVTMNLDLVPVDGVVRAVGTAPVPAVTSVVGATGPVDAATIFAALEPDLSLTIVSVVQDTVGDVEGIVRGGFTLPDPIPADFILFADAADSEAPTAPSSLTATLTTTGVSLSWGASVDNVAVASYKVFRNGVAIAVVYALTYQDTTAAWDTTYAYTVKAVDLAGNESPASNSVNATRGISGAPVVPMTLDGAPLVAHFRMSDMLGLVTPGADAPTLKNRVSDGADLVMFGTPTFETSGRVRPCILFDGVNDAANAAIGTYAQPTTRIIVFKMGTVANSKTIMGTRTSGSLRQTFLISADSLGYNVYAGSTRTIAVVPNATGAHISAVRYQGATSYANIDGTAYTIASPGTESGDGIRLAADSSGAVRTHMEAYDVIQYAGAVTDASIASLVASLKTWYGI